MKAARSQEIDDQSWGGSVFLKNKIQTYHLLAS